MPSSGRIELIPHQHSWPRRTRWGGRLCLLGGFMFLGGLAAVFVRQQFVWLAFAIAGWALIMVTMVVEARGRRRNWQRLPARCLASELRRVSNPKGGYSWQWRLLCEYEHAGQIERVTPTVYWRTFWRSSSAERFLAARVDASGNCELFVNPDDPLETELVGKGIMDWLLLPRRLRRAPG